MQTLCVVEINVTAHVRNANRNKLKQMISLIMELE